VRLFLALDIDDMIRDRIRTFQEGVRGFAPDARWARPESMHVTLKFIGERPSEFVDRIRTSLARAATAPFEISFRGHGFFPSQKAPRVFWVGIQAGPELSTLAANVDEATAKLGAPPDDHPFSPHLTLARRGGGSGVPHWRKGDAANPTFQHLSEKLAARPSPDFGTMTAREFFLYESKLSPEGSRYSKLERFPLLEEKPADKTSHTS
jgi:2'-5' RNA ligase